MRSRLFTFYVESCWLSCRSSSTLREESSIVNEGTLMAEESAVPLPHAEESIEAETDTALEQELGSGIPPPEPTSEPSFVCNCEESMRSACKGLPSYMDLGYCVLHYPGVEKSADFKAALDSKLNKKDFDFRGVWFPDEVDFSGFEFSTDA